MKKSRRDAYRDRAQMVLNNLKNCNSGCEVHQVGNMRNIAVLVIEMMDKCKDVSEKLVEGTLKRLEAQQTEFFKKKFENWKK